LFFATEEATMRTAASDLMRALTSASLLAATLVVWAKLFAVL
jgi:hypothetical protein